VSEADKAAGWLTFAGFMILIAGLLNVLWGVAAIDNAKFFVGQTHFIVSDLNMWGWTLLIVGVVQAIAAISILSGGIFGRWVGVLTAALSALGVMVSIDAYPLWSLAVFALDVLVIYGLVTYGGVRLRTI
jgi:hypothetical protein